MTQTATVTGIEVTPAVGTVGATIPVVNTFQDILFKQDLQNVFMNSQEFAELISYYHSSLDKAVSYAVIFDDPHMSVSLGQEAEFNSLRPQFQVSEAELEHRILKNDFCTVRGVDYHVEDYVSDGVGVTTVFLRLK